MKHFSFIFFTIFLINGGISQSIEQKKILTLDMYSISKEWTDPNLPKLETADDLLKHPTLMEMYAKQNPPFPILLISNPTKEQLEVYKNKVDIWAQRYGKYFPTFIEYSKYDMRLSKADDYKIYFAARQEWLKRNKDKAQILNEEIGTWIVANPEKYNTIMKTENK